MSDIFQLTKWRVSALIAMSAFTGYLVRDPRFSIESFITFFAVFFLASGAAAYNQVQEADLDAQMNRTRRRPIPAGRIQASSACSLSILLIGLGFTLLLVFNGPKAAMPGLLAVALYNGIYTVFKRKNAFVLLPGAISGSIPPAIGWISAGGSPADPALWLLMIFFFIWQIPHFWLIHLLHAVDFRQTRLPSLIRSAPAHLARWIILVWIVAIWVLSLLFPLYDLLRGRPHMLILGLSGATVVLIALLSLRRGAKSARRFATALYAINGFAITTMIVLIIDKQLFL